MVLDRSCRCYGERDCLLYEANSQWDGCISWQDLCTRSLSACEYLCYEVSLLGGILVGLLQQSYIRT